MALHFDYASAAAPTSSKRPAPTATRGSSYTAPLALRFLYSFLARDKLKEEWKGAYERNMKRFIPGFAKQLYEDNIPVNGVKAALRT